MNLQSVKEKYQITELPNLTDADFEKISQNEKAHIVDDRKSVSYWADAWRRLKKNKVAMFALCLIIVLVLFAVLGPYLSPYTYDQQVRGDEKMAPCLRHPFGTDQLGRDLLVRTMIGARISLLIGIVSAVIVLVIGSIYGAISGLAGGMVDNIMMRIVDVLYSIPTILLVIAIKMVIEDPLAALVNKSSSYSLLNKMGSSLIAIFIVYALLYWVGMARIVRGEVLKLKQMEYINAAAALGANKNRLIFKHLLPNCIGQLIVNTMLQVPSAIFTEAFLSFLGIGVSVPMASLGSLCSNAVNGVVSYPYRLLYPSLIISLIILGFNLLGDGLRDAFDPRLKN